MSERPRSSIACWRLVDRQSNSWRVFNPWFRWGIFEALGKPRKPLTFLSPDEGNFSSLASSCSLMGPWRESGLGLQEFDLGWGYYSLSGKLTHKRRCPLDWHVGSFQWSLPCLRFCSSKANPVPPHRPYGALQGRECNHSYLMSSKQPGYAFAIGVWGCSHRKFKYAVSAYGKSLMGAINNTILKWMVLANACAVPYIAL